VEERGGEVGRARALASCPTEVAGESVFRAGEVVRRGGEVVRLPRGGDVPRRGVVASAGRSRRRAISVPPGVLFTAALEPRRPGEWAR
jgi:hypothetical protein